MRRFRTARLPLAVAALAAALALLLGRAQPAQVAGQEPAGNGARIEAAMQAAELRLVGARAVDDEAFEERDWGVNSAYLGDHLDGGRLFVVLANDGDIPVTIEEIEIGGRSLDELTDDTLFSERIASLNWWQAAPRTLAPGDLTGLRIRLLDRADFGDPVRLTLGTDSGDVELVVSPQRPPLWLPFVGFTGDGDGALTRATVYVANGGSAPIRLPAGGGVRIDELPVPGRPAQTIVPPGGVVPVALDLDTPPAPGDWVVVEVTAEGGESTIGSLRAFAADFSLSFWNLGENTSLDAPHLAGYGIDLATPGSTVAVDEPFRVRMAPGEMAARLEARRDERPEAPTMVQLSGYEEVLLYSDLADITMTHHRETELDLSLALSWPKPIWYLPQDAWGRNTRPESDESWYPLEELEHQALTGVAGGAKHLQWFTYWNLWQQGHGRGGGFDATRSQLDLSLSGAVGNPALFDRVGRLSLVLRLLDPYLEVSAPAGRLLSPDGIEAATLVSGMDRGVVVLLDRTSSESLYGRSEPGGRPATLAARSVEAPAPSYLVAERAFLLDPFEGVQELPLERIGDERIRLELARFTTAAVVVLGDEGDGEKLRDAWAALSFPDPDEPLERIAAWAERPVSDWRRPEARFRLPIAIENDTERNRQVFEVVLDAPPTELDDGDRFTLLELGPGDERREIALQYTADVRFFAPAEREGDLLEPGGSDDFAALHSVERGPEGIVNRYRSHESERYAFTLTPAFAGDGGEGDGWISTDLRRLELEARGVEAGHAAKGHRLFVDFDLDGDGERDGGTNLLLIDQPALDLGGDLHRYRVDVAAAFAARFPDEPAIRGRWRPRFQIEVAGDERRTESQWTLLAMRAYGNARLLLIHPDGIPAGETRSFELYVGRAERADTNPPLPMVPGARLPVRAGPVEVAGVDLAFDDAGRLLLTPQAAGSGLLLQRWSAGGEVLARARLPGPERAALPGELFPAAGEVLDITVVGEGGAGYRFAYVAGDDGALYDLSRESPPPSARPGLWSDRADGWEMVDGDLSPDGKLSVVAERRYREDEEQDDEVWFGRLRLLDAAGATVWTWPAEGERSGTVFAARFDASGERLFVAAQRTPIDDQDYDETDVMAFDLRRDPPAPLWRRPSGEGREEPGRAVHHLVPTGDGGLLYADWHGQIFRLAPDGGTRWSGRIGGYALALADDGADGAYALNFSGVHHLDPDGADERVASRADGSEGRAMGVASGGDLVAFADTRLTLLAGAGATSGDVAGGARPLLGRHPRVIAVADGAQGEPRVAVGASDGLVQLFGSDGIERWSHAQRGSMVSDLRFLANGTLLVARETFAYDPDTLWRYRTVVEAFTSDGGLLWTSPGPWREQPSMARLALDDGERVAMVIGGEARRLELP